MKSFWELCVGGDGDGDDGINMTEEEHCYEFVATSYTVINTLPKNNSTQNIIESEFRRLSAGV